MKPETPQTQIILCPYCGHVQTVPENTAIPDQCDECRGLFEPLSRRATQISMGPWYIRDKKMPFRPGCSYEVVSKMAKAGRIKPTTVMRGPSTKQFWSVARNVPGIAHLLGYCHECNAKVQPTDAQCSACGTKFDEPRERNELGLAFKTAGEATAAQKALEKEIAALTGGSGGSGINRAINAPPAAPGAGLLDEVLGPGGKFGGSPLLNFGGEEKTSASAAPAAPKPPAPPRPAAAQPGKPAAPKPAARAAVDAFSLGDDMDDTGLDPVIRKQKLAGMWTWILVGFNALLILVVIFLFLTKGKKPTDNSPDPNTPASQGESPRGKSATGNGATGAPKTGAVGSSGSTGNAANPTRTSIAGSQTGTAQPENPAGSGSNGAAVVAKPGPTPEQELAQFNQMQGVLKTAREKIDAGDSQACLALLIDVRDNYPAKWHPPDLSERITQISTALSRAAVAEGDKARFKEMEVQLRTASDLWAKKELVAALKILQDIRDNYPREWHPGNLATEIARLTKQLEQQKDASFFGQKIPQ